MVRQGTTRRRFLLATGVAGVGGLAGCLESNDGTEPDGAETDPDEAEPTEPDPTETEETATSVADDEPVTVSGRVADGTGTAVTVGEVISLGPPEGLVAVAPNDDGAFAIELTAGQEYDLQYTQGADGYPTDGLPDLYTIDRVDPDGDTDLGDIALPAAYDVDVTVETESGEDVTDDTSVFVSHVNGDVTTGFELLNNPIELAGQVRFDARYDGRSTDRTVTVTDATSVTLTV